MVINDWVHIELDEHMKFDRTKKETWCTFFSAVHSTTWLQTECMARCMAR